MAHFAGFWRDPSPVFFHAGLQSFPLQNEMAGVCEIFQIGCISLWMGGF
jgi:hypothetical protein